MIGIAVAVLLVAPSIVGAAPYFSSCQGITGTEDARDCAFTAASSNTAACRADETAEGTAIDIPITACAWVNIVSASQHSVDDPEASLSNGVTTDCNVVYSTGVRELDSTETFTYDWDVFVAVEGDIIDQTSGIDPGLNEEALDDNVTVTPPSDVTLSAEVFNTNSLTTDYDDDLLQVTINEGCTITVDRRT